MTTARAWHLLTWSLAIILGFLIADLAYSYAHPFWMEPIHGGLHR